MKLKFGWALKFVNKLTKPFEKMLENSYMIII